MDCTFYGPHPYHLGRCKSQTVENCAVNEENEILLVHFFNIPHRPEKSKKVILSCHEKEIFPVKKIKSFWDEIVYVSNSQMFWQGVPGTVIPNVITPIQRNREDKSTNIAGIIGTIDRNKNTHISIQRALADNCDKVILFGIVTDNVYWEQDVKHLIDGNKVIFKGYVDNRDEMYSSIDVVYQSSDSECASLTSQECKSAGIEFRGNKNIEEVTTLVSNSDILEKWKKVLDYDNW